MRVHGGDPAQPGVLLGGGATGLQTSRCCSREEGEHRPKAGV